MSETTQTADQIKAAAIAELEGSNSSVATETTETVSEDTTETVEASEESEIDTEETEETEETDDLPNESDDSDTQESSKEAEMRKKIEKELKKKYYSKLNQEQKKAAQYKAELESLKESGFSDEQIEAMRKVVRHETQEQEIGRVQQIELDNFVKKYTPSKADLNAIKEIVSDFPQMSYEAARKFHLAQTRPEELIKPKTPNLSVKGGTPKAIEK